MKILVTGGAGYIGSHCIVSLIECGFEVVVIDNLYNSTVKFVTRIEAITGKKPIFSECDLKELTDLEAVFSRHRFDAVIHFAGLKAVGESVQESLSYYNNNVLGTLNLLTAMEKYNVKNLIFSSSATVYGQPDTVPLKESMFCNQPTSPYGKSKWILEKILEDVCISDHELRVVCLRYFNPVGAHKSGLIGEDPLGIPNNLVPYIADVAMGKRDILNIFGDDYDTPDGTGIRDYIHVVDLAEAHVKALLKIPEFKGCLKINIGTGKGYSVLEVIEAFKKASGCHIPTKTVARRSGDVGICYAETTLAKNILDWSAKFSLDEMCEDTFRWYQTNANNLD